MKNFPQHLESYFIKLKKDKLVRLGKYAKRYYVFSVTNNSLSYYKTKRDYQTSTKELGILKLSEITKVVYHQQPTADKQAQLLVCEKPNAEWIHAFEIVTADREYRLFTDNYDTKQQWVFTILSYLKHRVQPANSQGPVLIDFKAEPPFLPSQSKSFNNKHKYKISSHQFVEPELPKQEPLPNQIVVQKGDKLLNVTKAQQLRRRNFSRASAESKVVQPEQAIVKALKPGAPEEPEIILPGPQEQNPWQFLVKSDVTRNILRKERITKTSVNLVIDERGSDLSDQEESDKIPQQQPTIKPILSPQNMMFQSQTPYLPQTQVRNRKFVIKSKDAMSPQTFKIDPQFIINFNEKMKVIQKSVKKEESTKMVIKAVPKIVVNSDSPLLPKALNLESQQRAELKSKYQSTQPAYQDSHLLGVSPEVFSNPRKSKKSIYEWDEDISSGSELDVGHTESNQPQRCQTSLLQLQPNLEIVLQKHNSTQMASFKFQPLGAQYDWD